MAIHLAGTSLGTRSAERAMMHCQDGEAGDEWIEIAVLFHDVSRGLHA